MNNAVVTATVRSPSGEELRLPLEWTVDKDGEYRGSFIPQELGTYEIRVEAEREGERLGGKTTCVEVAELEDEYFHAEMRAGLLKRIAEETGGAFYTLEDLAHLPEDLSYTEGGAAVIEQKDLWDMPVLFLLLVGLLGTEWSYRKLRGLS